MTTATTADPDTALLSFNQVGKLVGRHPEQLKYWVRKGLKFRDGKRRLLWSKKDGGRVHTTVAAVRELLAEQARVETEYAAKRAAGRVVVGKPADPAQAAAGAECRRQLYPVNGRYPL